MSKLGLYIGTLSHLRPAQVGYRVMKRAGLSASLWDGRDVASSPLSPSLDNVPFLPELDLDQEFTSRFDVDALLRDEVVLLHHAEQVDWTFSWHQQLESPLWDFNLHYCEYLLPLAAATQTSGDERYVAKGKEIIDAWIRENPQQDSEAGWSPYTIALRTVNWISFAQAAGEAVAQDAAFMNRLNFSLAEQYLYLADHLERDVQANHLFEDLKALVVLATYFDDKEALPVILDELSAQIAEQILPDGMHYERSFMYHKIVLEGMLRIAVCLERFGEREDVIQLCRLQDMCDAAFSAEDGLARTPLFNDSGDNVAKPLAALLACAQRRFGIVPEKKQALEDAGYWFMSAQTSAGQVFVIFDAGAPGPAHALGHAHCDALSFEVFIDGKPVMVNRGTFAYQGSKRSEYRATAAHNTAMVDGTEQSQCWSSFRMARYAQVEFCGREVRSGIETLSARVTDWQGHKLRRILVLCEAGLIVHDKLEEGQSAEAFFHFADITHCGLADTLQKTALAPEYGLEVPGWSGSVSFEDEVTTHVLHFEPKSGRGATAMLAFLYGQDNAGDFAICYGALDVLLESYDRVIAVSRYKANSEQFAQQVEALQKRYGARVQCVAGPFTLDRTSKFSTLTSYTRGAVAYARYTAKAWNPKLMQSCKCIYINGGNLLRCESATDRVRLTAILYYAKLARRMGIPYCFMPQSTAGISAAAAKEIGSLIDSSEALLARESLSRAKFQQICTKPVLQSLDAAFFIGDDATTRVQGAEKFSSFEPGTYACITLRRECIGDIGQLPADKIASINTAIDELVNGLRARQLEPVFVCQTYKDLAFTQETSKRHGARMVEEYEALMLRELYRGAAIVAGMRLHSLILAASVGTPVAGLFDESWGLKNPGIMGDISMPYVFIDAKEPMSPLLDEALQNRQAMIEAIAKSKNALAEVVERNAQ